MKRLVLAVLVLAGCNRAPSAMSVCKSLEAAKVAVNCRPGVPSGLGAAAKERAEFDLISVPGRGGSVLSFDGASQYERTVASYSEMSGLAGPHRYGNAAVRIFVQMNSGAPESAGAAVRAALAGL